MQAQGIHHLHRRKRIHQQHQPYPHPNKWIRLLDKVVLIIAILAPLGTLPQVYKIYAEKSAAGVSAFTWALYAIFSLPWLVYGIVHKEKPIAISYSLNILTYIAVIAGILLYS